MPQYHASGQILKWFGTCTDIEDIKRSEKALRLFRELLDQSSDAIEVIDPETGRFLDVNERACLDLGYSREESLGLNVCDVDPTVSPAAFKANVAQLRKTGFLAWQGLHRRKDGSSYPVEVNLKYIRLDYDYMVGSVRDITDRQRGEADRARLITAVEQSAEMIMITDARGAIQYVNPAFEKTTGYTKQELIGQNPRILKSGAHDAAFYHRMWDTLSAGEVWRGHMRNRRKDGTRYEDDASISPVRDAAGKIVNFVAAMRDVTHEVELEHQLRQSQKMEAVGRLAGGVAHDFNNMLQVILGNAELCKLKIDASDPLHKWLDEINKGAQHARILTRQLLTFARKQVIEPEILNINDTIADMLKLLPRLVGEDITVVWRPGDLLALVKMDPAQIDQILTNLAVNARDAIKGTGTITIETANANLDQSDCAQHPGARPGNYVLLTFSDTGCGMDPETITHIFEPFFTTKGVGVGTGLGLAMVYGIIKQNDGHIEVNSEPGHGTQFKIYLPYTLGQCVQPVTGETPEVAVGGAETILLVEDEETVRAITREFLASLGYTVLVAETPEIALRLAIDHHGEIQLLLTDVIMPGMNGRDLFLHLAEIRPAIKCLFISGFSADVLAQRGILDSGLVFLSKPFSRDLLARRIRETLTAYDH